MVLRGPSAESAGSGDRHRHYVEVTVQIHAAAGLSAVQCTTVRTESVRETPVIRTRMHHRHGVSA
jgi:hypothetical protein